MGYLSHHITRREAPVVCLALRRGGYSVKLADCYRFVSNLADWLEPLDRSKNRRVSHIILAAVGDCREEIYTAQVDMFFAEEELEELRESEILKHAEYMQHLEEEIAELREAIGDRIT